MFLLTASKDVSAREVVPELKLRSLAAASGLTKTLTLVSKRVFEHKAENGGKRAYEA